MWILIVVSTVFGNPFYSSQGITSVVFEKFSTEVDCHKVAQDIYKKVKDLGYDPQKYIQASCIPLK